MFQQLCPPGEWVRSSPCRIFVDVRRTMLFDEGCEFVEVGVMIARKIGDVAKYVSKTGFADFAQHEAVLQAVGNWVAVLFPFDAVGEQHLYKVNCRRTVQIDIRKVIESPRSCLLPLTAGPTAP
jgi:hypothetical protein